MSDHSKTGFNYIKVRHFGSDTKKRTCELHYLYLYILNMLHIYVMYVCVYVSMHMRTYMSKYGVRAYICIHECVCVYVFMCHALVIEWLTRKITTTIYIAIFVDVFYLMFTPSNAFTNKSDINRLLFCQIIFVVGYRLLSLPQNLVIYYPITDITHRAKIPFNHPLKIMPFINTQHIYQHKMRL